MGARKTMMAKMFLLLVAAWLFGGCAPATKMVKISSTPSAATVYINGQESGITPLTKELSFERNKPFDVVAKKEGYKEGRITILGFYHFE